MPLIAVVILNYNGKKLLEKFLPGVLRYSLPHQTIVVDNGSTDDSISFLEEKFPEVSIIAHGKNLGFCRGYNEAIKDIDSKYIVLLNNDVKVTPNWLDPMLDLVENNPIIAACQPKIKSYKQPDFFEYAGAAGGFIDYLGYPFCRGRIFDQVEKDTRQYEDISQIFWSSGAAMFLRRDLYIQTGGLDEDLFAHMEEIDLCWRFQSMGYQIFFMPKSLVYHMGGGTLSYQNPNKIYLNFRNNLIVLFKNLPFQSLFYVFFLRYILDCMVIVKFMFEGKFIFALKVIQAYLHFYKNLFRNIQKRWRNLDGIKIKRVDLYPKSILWNAYIFGRKSFWQLENKK